PLDLDLGRVVTLEAKGLGLAAPDWAASPTLAAVDRLRVSVDLGAWLGGDGLVLPEVRLERPKVALERDAQGRASWTALAGDGDDADDGATVALPRIGDLTIEGGEIAYRDTAAGVALQAGVATVAPAASSGSAGGGDDFGGLTLDGRGEVLGDALTFALRVGSPLLLARPGEGQPFPIDGRLSLAGTEVSLKGGALDPLTLHGLDIALDATSPDPTKLLALLGRPAQGAPPPPRDLALKARLTRPAGGKAGGDAGGGGAFEFADLDARWGESRLAGRLGYDPGGESRRPTLDGELRSTLLDLRALRPVLAGGPPPAVGLAPPAPAHPAAADDAAGQGFLATHDAHLGLAADMVRLPEGPDLREVAANVLLERGRLALDPVRAVLPEGRLAGRAEVPDAGAATPAATLRLEADSMGFGQFGPLMPPEVARDLAGTFTGTLEGTVRGASAGEILAGSELALKGRFAGLRYRDLTVAEAPLDARLADGALTLDPLRLDLAKAGRLEGRVTLAGLAGAVAVTPEVPATAATPVGSPTAAATPPLQATVDLRAERLDLVPLAALAPSPPPLAGAFTGTLKGTAGGATPEALLAGADLALVGRFEGLRYGDDLPAARAVELEARLAGGRLTLDPLRLDLPQGQVAGRVVSGPRGADPPAAEV
ncbi:MAG TPA: hypothetical protein VF606_10525, partial [Geminicoccaceae bacterium]